MIDYIKLYIYIYIYNLSYVPLHDAFDVARMMHTKVTEMQQFIVHLEKTISENFVCLLLLPSKCIQIFVVVKNI